MNNRIQKYYNLNTKISYLSDNDIANLKKDKEFSGWGKNLIVTIDNENVFIKKLALTKLEYDNLFDSSNLYNLPTYYNYGIGSAGFNVFRELLMHIKTTNFVLDGEIENFPLMYHYRIIKNKNPSKFFKHKDELDDYITKWNNNENIRKYMIARDNAEYELIVFLEYFPHVLYDWLIKDINMVPEYINQMLNVVKFLRKHNIIHFDAHVGNILSDGKKFYLTDFGLVLDMEFHLSNEEKEFFKKNDYLDYTMIFDNIAYPLLEQLNKNKDYFDKKYAFDTKPYFEEGFYDKIYKNLDEIGAYLKYDNTYIQILKKYWELLTIYPIFHYNMRHNNKKDNVFPNDQTKKLISEIGLIGGYYDKYQKYKSKYLMLKDSKDLDLLGSNKSKYLELRNYTGGSQNLIIHISGPSGSGKTTLGNKLKEKFGNKIIIKDIDDLRDEFTNKYYGNKSFTVINKKAYQEFIDEYVNKQQKPLIFVGLNHMPWWHKNLYYNMHSEYNYYIDIDDMTIVKQKCLRALETLSGISNNEVAINNIINHNTQFIKSLFAEMESQCSEKEIKQMNKKWNHDYKQQGYKFMSRENIFNDVSKKIKRSSKS